jgi:FMN phosphatase YigB (HAD superfamily)
LRYAAVFFDWGDTLAPLDSANVPQFQEWSSPLINRLYLKCYRLAIISNTHRYQDAYWIRNELARRGILQCFEVVISSALYAIHKPDLDIFHKALDFMQLDPFKVLMVGDSEHCDGACRFLGCDYLKVKASEHWADRFLAKIDDPMPSKRKLSNLYEYGRFGNKIVTKVRHLSEGLQAGDIIMLNQEEVKVVSINRQLTKEDILKAKEDFVEIEIEPVCNGI